MHDGRQPVFSLTSDSLSMCFLTTMLKLAASYSLSNKFPSYHAALYFRQVNSILDGNLEQVVHVRRIRSFGKENKFVTALYLIKCQKEADQITELATYLRYLFLNYGE